MKAAGYIRVSTQAQADKGESLNTQRQQIEAYIQSKALIQEEGWTLTEIYEDAGRSGGNVDRPGLQSLMDDAKNGKFDVVVVPRLSRFARNTQDLLNKVEELKEYNVQFASIKETIDLTSPYGKFMLIMLAGVAELERETLKETMGDTKNILRNEKKILVGTSTLGYKWDTPNSKFVIVPREAKIYRRVVDMYLSGVSYADIALTLKEEGVKGKRSYLSPTTISYMLKNPAYYGRLETNKHIYKQSKSGNWNRTKELKPPDQWVTYKLEPLISKTDWDKLQEKTISNIHKSKHVTEGGKTFWLRDMLVCGECGENVKHRLGNRRKDGIQPRYYCCYLRQTSKKTNKFHDREKCKLPLINAAGIEKLVWNDFIKTISLIINPKPLQTVIDSESVENKMADYDKTIKSHKTELRKNKTAIKQSLELLKNPELNKQAMSTVANNLNDLENEKITILSNINDAKAKKAELKEAVKNNKEYLYTLEATLFKPSVFAGY